MRDRIVITGIGAVTPLGSSADEFWENCRRGESGVAPIEQFDTTGYPVRIGGEVKGFEPTDFMSAKDARRLDRFIRFAVAAAHMAVDDSGLTINDHNADRVGVLIGSGIGGIHTFEKSHAQLMTKGPTKVTPFMIPMMISDMASGYVSIRTGAKGPNTCVVTACASGAHAIGAARYMLLNGHADVAITGGAEAAVSPAALAGFSSMKALSTRNDDPQRASRPFDKTRDGFVIAEGAGVLVLERLSAALDRGANIYGELLSMGSTGDAYHMTAMSPCGEGAARAMRAALDFAGLRPEDIDYINAHGTSTQLNDSSETQAIKTVFGEHAQRLAVSSTKSMIGHSLGASGAIELIACLLALRDQVAPPTINYETPDPECDLDYIPNQARPMKLRTVMSNSFGFGGHNCSLIVRSLNGATPE